MILEAIKKKYDGTPFVDFGIPTADEQVRAAVGDDELYARIQTLDKDQADIVKQSFFPGYPREIPRESLDEFLAKYGFVPEPTYNRAHDSYYKVYKSKKYRFYRVYVYYIAEEDPIYAEPSEDDFMNPDFDPTPTIIGRQPKKIRYNFGFSKEFDYLVQEQGNIELYDHFDYDLQDEEDRETIESIILGRVKDKFIEAIKGIK